MNDTLIPPNPPLEKGVTSATRGVLDAALTEEARLRLSSGLNELKARRGSASSGMEITRAYTKVIDELLRNLFIACAREFGVNHGVSLLALGGYGRGELNIYSDIDLMLLYGKKLSKEIEALTKKILYVLWDLKLDVGFSIRNVKECVELAKNDIKTKTSLLDTRLILGEEDLHEELCLSVRKRLFSGKNLEAFIKEKVEEKELRHGKYGGSVYILEPNVKEGEGGLRDAHTAWWVTKAIYGGEVDIVETAILGKEEANAFFSSIDFLHWVRNELHFEAGKKNDQITFDQQERIAKICGFKDSAEELAVEAFMRKYYMSASVVLKTSDVILSRCLQPKKRFLPERKIRIDDDFVLLRQSVSIVSDDLFERKPFAIMTAFEHSNRLNAGVDRRTKDLIMSGLPKALDKGLRTSAPAGASFVNILKSPRAYGTLEDMHRTGLLSAYMPEFADVTCKVQHDMYHVYTVDTHSLFAVRELERLRGEYKDKFRFLSSLLFEVERPEILTLSVLLHDIGKSMGKGHAENGARLVPVICGRIGFNEDDANLAAFLIREHLLLADTAQYRDLHDEKLIIGFAKRIGDAERLKLLYLLTFADVRAVGPEVWSQWKGALFQELYFKAVTVLERGIFEMEDTASKLGRVKERIKEKLKGEVTEEEVESHFGLLPPRYFLSTAENDVAEHVKTIQRLAVEPVAMSIRQVPEREYTEFVVATHDVHGLFSMITGVMAANSVNILGAQINTMTNGIALDVLQVKSAIGELITDEAKIRRIEICLSDVITGKIRVDRLVEKMKPSILDRKIKPKVPTRIAIDNEVSETFTVLDIHTEDRIGLLYRISSALSSLGLYIHVAKISTKGDAVADIFYVKDIFGQKITWREKLEKIEETLRQVIG
ncbi:MAG: [protein-PII] uridylyltransferase [Thermodesulfobacteriota bacterium]